MLLTERRAAFAAPLAVLAIVSLTHLGARSSSYASSLPEKRGAPTQITADGHCRLYEGVPVNGDAFLILSLGRFLRGAPAAETSTMEDERCLTPFLQDLVGAGWIGGLAAGFAVNLLFAGAAVACAVDLALLLGRGPLAAAIFGCLLAGTRGVGFYIGDPDAHVVAFAWVPIGAWLFERLAIADPSSPRANALLFATAAGAALLCYLGDVALLGFVWIYGLRRAPLARLFAITIVALALHAAWHGVGRAAGLGFDVTATRGPVDGVVLFAKTSKELVDYAIDHAPKESSKLAIAGRAIDYLWHGMPGIALARPIVPAFGLPLCLLALAGLFVAERRERRLGLALFLPAWAAAVPMNMIYNVPRVAHAGVAGLALLAAIALGATPSFVRRELHDQGLSERAGGAIGLGAVVLALALLLVHENRDVFGDLSLAATFHYGRE